MRIRLEQSGPNEVFSPDGTPRPLYAALFEELGRMGLAGWRERTGRARGRLLEEQRARGFSEGYGDRSHPTDWLPRLVPGEEWKRIEAGLGQRARAINEFLRRLERGTQEVVPPEVISSSTLYSADVPTRFGEVPAPHIGFDLVAVGGTEGSWDYLVIEDNVRMPVGAMAMTRLRGLVPRIFPESFDSLGVRPLGDALSSIGQVARAASTRPAPTLAVLSDGPADRYYLDHALLADGADALLALRDEVYLDGDGFLVHGPSGRRIDVLYERLEGGRLWDELPGVVEAHQEGKLWIFFPPNVGIADDKGVYPFVPDMIRAYLDEEPLIPNVPTYSLAVEGERRRVMDRFEELVVKGRDGWGGKDVFIAPAEDRETVEAFKKKVEEDPVAYVAQELVDFSTHVLVSEEGDGLAVRDSYADHRVHALSPRPGEAAILPGSLTRLAAPGSRKVNVSGGGFVKDTWVLS